MTTEQEKKLYEIGKKIQELFPDMYGNVFFRFNITPNRKQINMNYGVEESKILDPNQ